MAPTLNRPEQPIVNTYWKALDDACNVMSEASANLTFFGQCIEFAPNKAMKKLMVEMKRSMKVQRELARKHVIVCRQRASDYQGYVNKLNR